MVTKSSATSVDLSTEKTSPTQGAMIVMLIASLLLNTLCLYFLLGYSFEFKTLSKGDNAAQDSSVGIRKVLLDLEYEKVG